MHTFDKDDKDNAISDVIQKFNKIESLTKTLIVNYIKPDDSKKSFVELFLLHNTIMSFGAKLKIIKQINADLNWFTGDDFEKFHQLINIRNAFAHSTTHGMTHMGVFPLKFPVVFRFHVEQSGSSKIFGLKPMQEQYDKFNEIYGYLEDKIANLISSINSSDSNSSES